MYVPDHFAEHDRSRLLTLIRAAPLGTLVIGDSEAPEVNHIPFVLRAEDADGGSLCAHIPRANPLSARIEYAMPCLVVFHGPQGYVSPSWYATKPEDGRVVPTWNYEVVHVQGRARLIDDADWISAQIDQLTDEAERNRPEPWAVADAPAGFTKTLMEALVGIEIRIERMTGKTKASQNQRPENRASVLAALRREQPDSAFTRWMRSVLEPEN